MQYHHSDAITMSIKAKNPIKIDTPDRIQKSLSKISNTSCIHMDERSRGGVDTFWWQDIIQTYVIESIQRLDIWSKSNLSNLIGVYGRGNIDGVLAGSQCRPIVSRILP